MLNIFNKYLGDEDGSKLSSESRILFGELSDSKSKTEQINDIILSYAGTDKRPRVVEAVGDSRSVVAETSAAAVAAGATAESIGSVDVATELQDKIKLSLEPSLNLIQKNMSLVELYEFFEKLRGTWKQQPKGESLFIRDLLVSGNVEGRNSLVEEIRKHSKETPETPVVNVFTLPILINFIIKTVSFKYQDPQLSLSIFNLLKDDLNFYTICCNQQTYNEIMRIHWIFNGKSNLYGVEMILLEMVNNGFNGDLMTFNLLEKIIVDYHNMRLGIDLHGSNRVQSIWNNEDDKRVHVLEKKLHAMGNRLRKEKGEKLF